MTTLIVYDSVFGNTGKVAEAIADEVGGDVRLRSVSAVTPADLDEVTLLVVGSPTRGFRPTPAIQEYIAGLPADRLNGLRVAAFDTRLDLKTIHPAPLRWVVEVGGYAANVLETELAELHCTKAVESAGFLVTDTEGPLGDGEIERARTWAKSLRAADA